MFNVKVQFSFDDLLKVVDQLTDEQKQILQNHLNQVPKPPLKKRTPGLGEGTIWMSDDFTTPLPDDFWFGEDT